MDYEQIYLVMMCIATILAVVNFVYERKAVKKSEELLKELEDSKTREKALEDAKMTLENSLCKLKNVEMVTKRLQIGNKSYKLVTKVDIPLEVFVYPSDSPCINDGLKEKIALSIAKELVSDDLMTVSWQDDGLEMLRHAEASVNVLCDKGNHWF